ncbi:uncharacterized protein [Dysidea avara]|uniref:uncharacterized protein n=1 Tax=Dysidea avara TaxID=196820 RepID=UPI00331CC7A9
MELPVIDFSVGDVCSNDRVISQLHEAFTHTGFVFIKNHGIEQQKINLAFEIAKQFFKLPLPTKLLYQRNDNSKNSGYVCVEQESLNPSQPADLKECYNVSPGPCQIWPDVGFPFKETIQNLFLACEQLTLKILECMGKGLQLEDPQFFVKAHQEIGDTEKNFTTLRLLHYPPLGENTTIKPGQLRCGEHVDYGSVTLLFQDSIGGLQVKHSSGEYINAPYVPDAVLVNLGALMQNWTADKYLATPHRVLIPADETKRQTVRQSIAFFAHPDNKCLIKCIDGSNKYPPITAEDDLHERLARTY